MGYPIAGGAVLNYNAIGGNPTGYVSVRDPDNFDTFFQAPAAYHGNLIALLNGSLRYDIITDQSVDYDGADVVIKGGGLVLVYNISPPPASSAWTTVNVAIAPGSGWHLGTLAGAAPLLADFQTALAGVNELWIAAEYHSGTTETSGLDNVSLNSVDSIPEPASGLLGFIGLGAIYWMRRRL